MSVSRPEVIGLKLRERYRDSEELPPELVALVRQLDEKPEVSARPELNEFEDAAIQLVDA
jgi:hypothetical protein